jgi:hypothetical protein
MVCGTSTGYPNAAYHCSGAEITKQFLAQFSTRLDPDAQNSINVFNRLDNDGVPLN